MRSLFVVVVTLCFLNGCATRITAAQCEAANWADIGEQDGLRGITQGKLTQYKDECSAFDIDPTTADYERGYVIGLQQYCTAVGGFKAGYGGYQYHDNCPEDAEKEFYPQYVRGQELYRLELHIFDLETRLYRIENDQRAYRRSSKWADRRYYRWELQHIYSQLRLLELQEFRLRQDVVTEPGRQYLRPRFSRFGYW